MSWIIYKFQWRELELGTGNLVGLAPKIRIILVVVSTHFTYAEHICHQLPICIDNELIRTEFVKK